MTTDRNKLLELAKEAGPELRRVIENNDIDADLERFAALLQAQGEPQSSDQVWNEAIEIAAKICDNPNAGLVPPDGGSPTPREMIENIAADIRSLKRPSQAQEPTAPASILETKLSDERKVELQHNAEQARKAYERGQAASVSGAVDEREALRRVYAAMSEFQQQDDYLLAHGASLMSEDSHEIIHIDTVRKIIRAALSRAQATQPAQQAPAVSDEGPFGLALNVKHKKCHQAADAFWSYWNDNGETHKSGYYESTWGAINTAIKMVGVVPHTYGGEIPASLLSQPAAAPKLSVWYGSMPESNGKSNFTAILMRDGDMVGGHTIDRSEYPDCVRYEADRVRYLIGELEKEPFIFDYDADKHSGYVEPAAAPVSEQAVPDGYMLVSRERIQNAATHAKIAANNIVAMAKEKPGNMCGWLDDACTSADIAADVLNKLLDAAPSNQSQGGDKP